MIEHATHDAALNTADLFEIIRTTRSMWRLKPDVVPNELIRTGTCTPGLSDLPDLSGRVAL
jgi:hypothetical protein